ncbi:MAG: hypothetical protein LC101_02985 [Flavobacteriales bacterium]|nr:hypothetical protein [Flavobacteriales bacterium]
MEANQQEDILIAKLDSFIRKYYKNELIKGGLYTTAIFLIFFLAIILLEYFGHFGTGIRTFFFYSFISINLFIFIKFIFIPAAKLFSIGKRISYEQAAEIIGKHFKEIDDKIINTLQLRNLAQHEENTLILASIQQKSNELLPIPFNIAINFRENKKYIIYALPPFIVFLGVLLFSPGIITQSTFRIVSHGTYFEPQAPFKFNIINQKLVAVEGEDFTLLTTLSGAEIPEQLFIDISNSQYKMLQQGALTHAYTFKNPRKDIQFRFAADGFFSPLYTLKVLPKPVVMQLQMDLQYPAYLKMKPDSWQNRGDATMPEGTVITWKILTKNTENLSFLIADSVLRIALNQQTAVVSHKAKYSFEYTLVPSHAQLAAHDSLRYQIQVIPDEYPAILVKSDQDTANPSFIFFNGQLQDDYGLRKLVFNYKINDDNFYTKVAIPLQSQLTEQAFFYALDLALVNVKPGDKLSYYFEVWDNDGVNGSKSSKSALQTYKMPTKEELQKAVDSNKEKIKDDLQESKDQLKDIDKSVQDIKKDLFQKKETDWSNKQKLNQLLEKQKNLMEQMEKSKELNEKNNKEENRLSEEEKRLLEKQEKLEKMFEELKNEDILKLLEEIEKSMEKMDKNKLKELLDKFQLKNEELEKELDRTMALFKQLEFEQKLQNTIDKLDELKKGQEKLAEKTTEKQVDKQQLSEQQKALQDQFDQLKDDLKKLEELNKDLEQPNDMPQTDDLQKEIDDLMNQSQQQMQNGQNSKSQQSQKKAASKMQEMQQQLQQMQESAASEQDQENLEDLRQILDNLLTVSFDQEDLMENLKQIERNSPLYKNLTKDQYKLKDDFKIIEDSLLALSKRMFQLSSFVNKEVSAVKDNMAQALSFMTERQVPMAGQKQQYALTSINNLALLLSEAIDQLQQQMQQQMQNGNKSCTKPGKSNPNMSGLIQKQAGLQQRMQELKQKMDKQQGQGKEGKSNENEQGEINKELVKLAAEQESIRKELQQLSESMAKEQRKMIQEIVKKMEENETDLLNKRINQNTLQRQNDITTRLLESERAQREQDEDEKRESNEGKDMALPNQKQMQEFWIKKQQEIELLKTMPPALRPYYKAKVSEYFNRF